MSEAARILQTFVARLVWRVRLRRALVVTAAAAAIVSTVALVILALPILGVALPSGLRSATVLGIAIGVTGVLALLAGATAPVSVARAARTADRRLGLEGALSGSLEFLGSADPMHRLLVRRTAGSLPPDALGLAMPLRPPRFALLAPVLTAAALLASGHAPAVPETSSASVPVLLPAQAALSRGLQHAAARLVLHPAGAGELGELSVESARHLLELDAALRTGRMTPAEVLARVRARTSALEHEVAAPGAAAGSIGPAEGGRRVAEPPPWLAELKSLADLPAEDAGENRGASVPGEGADAAAAADVRGLAGPGGTGDDAGLGAAVLGRTRGNSLADDLGSAAWSLPAPARAPEAGGGGHGGAGIETGDAPPDRVSALQIAEAGRPLSRRERATVEAYWKALEGRGKP